MARLSPPTWKTAGGAGQITELPCMTEVTLTVTPRRNLSGFEIEYRIHSSRVNVRPTNANPPLPAAEANGSTPELQAIRRDERVVVDRYPDMTEVTDVTRLIEIEQSGAAKPSSATLDVAVFDLTKDGDRANGSEDSTEISFNL